MASVVGENWSASVTVALIAALLSTTRFCFHNLSFRKLLPRNTGSQHLGTGRRLHCAIVFTRHKYVEVLPACHRLKSAFELSIHLELSLVFRAGAFVLKPHDIASLGRGEARRVCEMLNLHLHLCIAVAIPSELS